MAKIRNGFVSNSSSSSFIIGIANATKAGRDDVGEAFDLEKAEYNKWWGYLISDIDDTDNVRISPLDNGTYKLAVVSFDDTEVSCTAVPGDKIVVLSGTGPDEDSFFSVYNDSGDWLDIDYDRIDFDDFDKEDQEKADLIQYLGGEFTYGAGRDG